MSKDAQLGVPDRLAQMADLNGTQADPRGRGGDAAGACNCGTCATS